jgi:hypothetical protein
MSVDKAKVEAYFKQVVLDYNCGDIRALLDAELRQAGPLLNSVVNGIDIVGGMIWGFALGSGDRSTQFMKSYFSISEIARMLYALVRCGMNHEGTTKLAVKFFVHHERLKKGVLLYKDRHHCVWLNVTEFAHSYVDVIDRIALDVHSHLSHIPVVSPKDEALFVDALNEITADISEFCSAAEHARVEAVWRECNMTTSSSPFLSEWLSCFSTP